MSNNSILFNQEYHYQQQSSKPTSCNNIPLNEEGFQYYYDDCSTAQPSLQNTPHINYQNAYQQQNSANFMSPISSNNGIYDLLNTNPHHKMVNLNKPQMQQQHMQHQLQPVSRNSPVLLEHLELSQFKVQACKNINTHNHKQCKYYHSNKDRKRPHCNYSSELCTYSEDKAEECPYGDDCSKAHNKVEQLYSLEKYKMKFCTQYPGQTDQCEYGIYCSFAHSEEDIQLELIHHYDFDDDFYIFYYKTVWCPFNFMQHDRALCVYAHNWQDYRRKPQQYKYNCQPCQNWKPDKFITKYEDECSFECSKCHGWKEYEYHPLNYKTKHCTQGNQCQKGAVCPYFHSQYEKRILGTNISSSLFRFAPRNRLLKGTYKQGDNLVPQVQIQNSNNMQQQQQLQLQQVAYQMGIKQQQQQQQQIFQPPANQKLKLQNKKRSSAYNVQKDTAIQNIMKQQYRNSDSRIPIENIHDALMQNQNNYQRQQQMLFQVEQSGQESNNSQCSGNDLQELPPYQNQLQKHNSSVTANGSPISPHLKRRESNFTPSSQSYQNIPINNNFLQGNSQNNPDRMNWIQKQMQDLQMNNDFTKELINNQSQNHQNQFYSQQLINMQPVSNNNPQKTSNQQSNNTRYGHNNINLNNNNSGFMSMQYNSCGNIQLNNNNNLCKQQEKLKRKNSFLLQQQGSSTSNKNSQDSNSNSDVLDTNNSNNKSNNNPKNGFDISLQNRNKSYSQELDDSQNNKQTKVIQKEKYNEYQEDCLDNEQQISSVMNYLGLDM